MNIRWQSFFLIILILFSVALTRIKNLPFEVGAHKSEGEGGVRVRQATSTSQLLTYQKASLISQPVEIKESPARNWNVLDPKVRAKSVLIQSLDDYFPFFHYNTYTTWPMASLTKLLTALVVLEEIGPDKKIQITDQAIATEGESGDLRSGEIYAARDLIKIMLLTSSNDAAAAFEEHVGGKDELVRLLNQKTARLGMNQTILHDASGISDLNTTTSSDLLRLAKYILEHEPEIFTWTRLPHVLMQPTNDTQTRTVYNINGLLNRQDFLGGKTGTSEEAQENLLALFSLENQRLIMVLLGSPDRVREVDYLLNWVKEAYEISTNSESVSNKRISE